MKRPDFLQFLRKGLVLSSAAFPRFVETWNWLVSAFDSFLGDANLNPEEGHILVDRSDTGRPILRLVNTDKFGGGGSPTESSVAKIFEPSFEGGVVSSIGAGFFPFGRVFTWVKNPVIEGSVAETAFVVLRVRHPTEETLLSCRVVFMSGLTPDNITSNWTIPEYDHTDIPLYFVSGGRITMDCRNLLSLAVRELV